VKKLLYLALISIPFFSCSKDNDEPEQTTEPSTLNNGLLLYMPFNGNLGDSSGQANNGTGFGSVAYSSNRYFDQGRALALNGTNTRVEIPGQKFDTMSKFTFYMEFLPSNTNSMTLLSRTLFSVAPNMKQAFNLMINTGAGTRFQMKKAGNCDNTNTATAFGTLVLGQTTPSTSGWNYVAVTYNGSTISTYINGVLAATGNEPGATLCSGAPLVIGSWWEGAPAYFQGSIDEVRVYNRALSQSEITQIFQLHK
jgi:hypothetical protein